MGPNNKCLLREFRGLNLEAFVGANRKNRGPTKIGETPKSKMRALV